MIQFDMEGFRKDLEYLVNIDSGTGTAEGVAQVADHLAEKYRKLGLAVKRYVFDEKYGPCLEARNHPESEEIDLLLIGHMDTVFPPGTAAARPFRLEGDKAYGPGAADMKAGDLLAVALAENLLRSRPDLRICLANNCDEEVGSVSADPWIRRLGAKSRYCLCFEPGRADGSFIKTRRGVQKLLLKAQGIASHAGVNPDGGANAILELAKWICHFEPYCREHPGARANFDVIRGGVVFNMIPAEAECAVDIRFDTLEDLALLMAEFRRLAATPFDARVRMEIIEEGQTPPMVANANSLRLMETMREEGRRLGIKVNFIATGGGSDASRVSASGAATIDCCGPVGTDTHNEKECVHLDTVMDRLTLLYNVCQGLTGNSAG